MKKPDIDGLITKLSEMEFWFPWERGLTTEEIQMLMRFLIEERNKDDSSVQEV